MYDQEEHVFVPLEVSFVGATYEIDPCHTSYLLTFCLFTALLTMMCLHCRTSPAHSPIVVEARPATTDEKV